MNITNEQRKHVKKLQQKKYRSQCAQYTVEGHKGVQAALHAKAPIALLVADKEGDTTQEYIVTAEQHGIPYVLCNASEGQQITATDSWSGVLAVIEQQETELDPEGDIILLDRMSDPGNLGTIIRTADWFGIRQIILSEDSVDPYGQKVVRASMGSFFGVSVHIDADAPKTLSELKNSGYTAVAFNMNGKALQTIANTVKTVYIFGSESHGISETITNLVDNTYAIPGDPLVAESLNVAQSVAIALYQRSFV